MRRYLHRDTPKDIAPLGWFVRGHWYDNSAAKFWSGILRELADDYPEARKLELESCVAGSLSSDLLDPRASLQQMFESISDQEVEREMVRLAEELELLGPPGSTTYRITGASAGMIEEGILPEVDSEILAHLVAWLPEWAGIDEALWTDHVVKADFTVDSPLQTDARTISFTLNHAALHEGLYRCHLEIDLTRSTPSKPC